MSSTVNDPFLVLEPLKYLKLLAPKVKFMERYLMDFLLAATLTIM